MANYQILVLSCTADKATRLISVSAGVYDLAATPPPYLTDKTGAAVIDKATGQATPDPAAKALAQLNGSYPLGTAWAAILSDLQTQADAALWALASKGVTDMAGAYVAHWLPVYPTVPAKGA